MWDARHLARIAAEALAAHERTLRLEQAVRGLDALPEVLLHRVLRQGLADSGLGVHPEHPFPGEPLQRPKGSERERCDLVLTPDPDVELLDPLAQLRERDKAVGTLFQALAGTENDAPRPGAAPTTRQRRIGPAEAFWLEVKTIGQFTYTAGVPGPNRAYGTELVGGPAADLVKLEWDPTIVHAGELVVLFTSDEATADHDLGAALHAWLDRALPIGTPAVERFEIRDLIGNRVCTVALVPMRRAEP